MGKPKVKHTTKESAFIHADKHQQTTGIHKVGVYKCPKCNNWHVGRYRARSWYKRQKRNHDDILVGKLLAALKESSGLWKNQ